MAEYRHLNNGKDAPKKIADNWKLLFISEKPILKPLHIDPMKDKIQNIQEKVSEGENTNAIAHLDDNEFSDYLNGSGHWPFRKIP